MSPLNSRWVLSVFVATEAKLNIAWTKVSPGCSIGHASANSQETIRFSQLTVLSEKFGPEPGVLKANISMQSYVKRSGNELYTTL